MTLPKVLTGMFLLHVWLWVRHLSSWSSLEVSLSPGSSSATPCLGSPYSQVPGFLTSDPLTAMVFSLQFLSFLTYLSIP